MSQPVVVLGAGGHAKVLIDALERCAVRILGVTDSDPGRVGNHVLNTPVVGNDEVVLQYKPDEILLVNGIGSVGLPTVRRNLFKRFKSKGYRFASVIHPSAIVATNVVIGEGAQVMAGAVIQTGVRLGANSIVNTKASVDHDSCIGSHAHLAPGVTLSGQVSIGAGAHVGSGTTVIQGIKIGDEVLVGAGSLVLRDLPPKVTVYGVPAKVVER